MGLFSGVYDKNLKGDVKALGTLGSSTYDYGKGLTDEGLTGLRSLDKTYSDRLNDPLGAVGRGIFSRARGALKDDAIRGQRAGGARIFQLAAQSGGTLSAEAQGELNTRNQRGINEALFSGEADIANDEAATTLSETSKLFDRMEGIRKTLVGVGQDEKTRGLNALLQSLAMRWDKDKQKRQILGSVASSLFGAAAGGAAGGGAGAAAGAGGSSGIWGTFK